MPDKTPRLGSGVKAANQTCRNGHKTAITTAFRIYSSPPLRNPPGTEAGRTLNKAIFLSSRKTRLAASPHFFEVQFDKL